MPSTPAFHAKVWDLETTDLTTFMGRLIVASFLDLALDTHVTRTIHDFGKTNTEKQADAAERKLLRWTVGQVEEASVLIGHNTKSFDTHYLRGRLAGLGMKQRLPKRHHIDTYLVARYGFKGRPQGLSLENLADFFHCGEQKDKPSKWEWAASRALDPLAIRRLAKRCESDCRVNAMVWEHLEPYWHEWRGS